MGEEGLSHEEGEDLYVLNEAFFVLLFYSLLESALKGKTLYAVKIKAQPQKT
tara:strand:+ start:233 stop:388 length:156 start_codon:yes stop_codon:yes gene_type:complete